MGSNEATARSQTARILIADDHALVREGLRTMLSGEDGIEVIAEAHNGRQALETCRELGPDLVLMDVRMPVMDGLEATKRIKAEMPQTSGASAQTGRSGCRAASARSASSST